MAGGTEKNTKLIIAHRGESFDAPENTLAAIHLAWQRDASAVEIDIQLSADNKIVVFHDFNTKRIGGRNKKVKKQTLAELRELDAGKHKGEKWAGEKIPTLSEVLTTIPTNKKLIIEIKSAIEIIPLLKKAIEKSGLKNEQIEIICFDLSTIAAAKREMPQLNCLWLLDLDYIWINRIFPPNIDRIISKTKKYNLDGINVWAGKMLTSRIAKKIKAANLLLYCWTVNNPLLAEKLFNMGVDGVTTDRQMFIKTEISKK